MLATQDVYDIEVPDEVLRTRAERLIEMGRGISLMQRGDDGRIVTVPPTVTFGPSPRGPD
jgi:hypothetical protein